MPQTVLITAFGPFPGAPFNPTAALAKSLANRRRPALGAIRRVAHVFPTSYAAVERELPALIAKHRPDIVLMFGLATRTPHLRIEARARNRRSTLFADVEGTHPLIAIRAGGPAALRTRSPQMPLLLAARAARVAAALSVDAGKYLCNFAYWRALEASNDRGAWVQFVHVPKIARTSSALRGKRGKRRLGQVDLLRAGDAILRSLLTAARKIPREPERMVTAVRSSSDSAAARAERRVAAIG